MIIWRPKELVSTTEESIERINDIGSSNLSEIATRLSPLNTLDQCFSCQLPGDCLHIIVDITITENPEFEYFETQSDRLYNIFWRGAKRTHKECFVTYSTRLPDFATLNMDDAQEVMYDAMTTGEGDSLKWYFTIPEQKILISKDYEKLLGFMLDDDKHWLKHGSLSNASTFHASVITGPSGIGKSAFLDYLLAHRLRNRLPTISCCSPNRVHVYTHTGVRGVRLNEDTVISELGDRNCCVLIDLGFDVKKAPSIFYPTKRKARAVISSPPESKYLEFSKEIECKVYCLPTLGWKDLYCCSLTFVKNPENIEKHNQKMRDAYIKFGGIPRLCHRFSFEKNDFGKIERYIDAIPAWFDKFYQTVQPCIMPFSDSIHPVPEEMTRVEPIDDSWRRTRTVLASDHVTQLLLKWLYGNTWGLGLSKLLRVSFEHGLLSPIYTSVNKEEICGDMTIDDEVECN